MPHALRPVGPVTGLACIVLAAGGSRRLGRPKQLLRKNHKPLLINAVDAALAVGCRPVTVVLGADVLRLRALLARRGTPIEIVYNAAWREGMASSVRTALRRGTAKRRAVLFLVVDQPRVGRRELGRLVGAWRRRPMVAIAAEYAGRPGVPAIVPRRMLRDARTLTGDVGIRALLRAGAHPVRRLAMPEAAFDIDTPEQAERL